MSNPQYGNSIRVGSLRIGGWLPVRSFVIGLGTVVATMMIILLGYLIPGLVFLLGMFLGLAIFGIPFGDADLTLAARILRSLKACTARQHRGSNLREFPLFRTHL